MRAAQLFGKRHGDDDGDDDDDDVGDGDDDDDDDEMVRASPGDGQRECVYNVQKQLVWHREIASREK